MKCVTKVQSFNSDQGVPQGSISRPVLFLCSLGDKLTKQEPMFSLDAFAMIFVSFLFTRRAISIILRTSK